MPHNIMHRHNIYIISAVYNIEVQTKITNYLQ